MACRDTVHWGAVPDSIGRGADVMTGTVCVRNSRRSTSGARRAPGLFASLIPGWALPVPPRGLLLTAMIFVLAVGIAVAIVIFCTSDKDP